MRLTQYAALVLGVVWSFQAHALEDTLQNRAIEAVRLTESPHVNDVLDLLLDAAEGQSPVRRSQLYELTKVFVREDLLENKPLMISIQAVVIKSLCPDEIKSLADGADTPATKTSLNKLSVELQPLALEMQRVIQRSIQAKQKVLEYEIKTHIE